MWFLHMLLAFLDIATDPVPRLLCPGGEATADEAHRAPPCRLGGCWACREDVTGGSGKNTPLQLGGLGTRCTLSVVLAMDLFGAVLKAGLFNHDLCTPLG